MDIQTARGSIRDAKAPALVVMIECGDESKETKKGRGKEDGWSRLLAASPELGALNERFHGALKIQVERERFKCTAGKRLECVVAAPSAKGDCEVVVLAVVTGFAKVEAQDQWRLLGGFCTKFLKRRKISEARLALPESFASADAATVEQCMTAFSEGAHLAGYEFKRYRSKKDNGDAEAAKSARIVCLLPAPQLKAAASAAKTGQARAVGTSLARDLVNSSPCDALPRHLAQCAREVVRGAAGYSVKTFDRVALKRMGANLLLAVAQGSHESPYLIHLTAQKKGGARQRKKLVIIGKGVTFDSGGLSIKPGPSMYDMKCDMSGAAAVLGLFKALAAQEASELPAQWEVHGIIPTCENLISSHSVKPGDVVKGLSGKTVEILNTDAEGRLILADAFAYAAKLQPDIVIDLATLTGACAAALGDRLAGLFSNDDDLASRLLEIGLRSGDKLWRMPLETAYRPQLDSKVADLKNIGTGSPGAITAALFLKEFVPEGCKWAHLDIAGPAFVNYSSDYQLEGGTGFGVRLLTRLVGSVGKI